MLRKRHGLPLAAALSTAMAVAAALVPGGSGRRSGGLQHPGTPLWISPEPAPSITSLPVLFRWTAVPGADNYRLQVGTAPGTHDILDIRGIRGTMHLAEELPGARPLYARISSRPDGVWRHADLRLTVELRAAEWIYPVPGSAVVEPGRAFEWTPVPGALEYRLVIGSSPGATDVLDRSVGRQTRVDVGSLPLRRRLAARVHTRVGETWYWRDCDFAVQLGYGAARPIHPGPGATADLGRAFSWQAMPLATGYRLQIGSTPGGSELYDTGVLGLTRRFVENLPAGRTLFATLTTVYADRSADYRFEFRARPGAPTERAFVDAALATTVAVREMAEVRDAWPRTLLDQEVRRQGVSGPSCVQMAATLLRALTSQGNRLPSRYLNTCLLGNRYDCHTLVEMLLPSSGSWMLLDPTFAVTARRDDGEWATAGDLSDAVRRKSWAHITFVPLNAEAFSRLRSYYIDYPLLFVSVFGEEWPEVVDGPSILGYYEEVPLPLHEPGTYAIRCLEGPTAQALIDGRLETLTCQGRDRLSWLRPASTIEERRAHTIEVYRARRFLF
jgi:hypothetical protein